MPKYAILGATGSCGGSILRILAEKEENEIHVLVRSRSKLEKQVPEIARSSQVTIYEGSISSIDVLADCIKGTKVVFLTVAITDNIPHNHIAKETVESVVSALQKIRAETPGISMPRLVVLSSATTDDHLMRHENWLLKRMLFTAFYWIYTDLIEAEGILRSNADWLDSTYVKPGGLVNDSRKGHELSTDHSSGTQFLSFMDLAAGMIEIADSPPDKYVQQSVSVLPTSKDVAFEWTGPVKAIKGFWVSFFPFLANWLY